MRRLRVIHVVWAVVWSLLSVTGCGNRGAVTFNITAPSEALLNPVAPPQLVTEYDIRSASGSVIGIASAVQGSGQSADGLLPLGALMPSAMPEDVYVTALSGGTTLGLARIKDVSIAKSKKVTYEADLRKPLVFVGSALPAESGSGNATTAVQVIDPLTEMDLAKQPMTPVSLQSLTAAASTWDGRFVVVANGSALTAFDTGSGKSVAGTLNLAFAPTRIVVAPRDQAIVALDPGTGGNGSLAIISDVAGFVGSPGSANPIIVRLPGAIARTAAFSPDGTKLYVLTGGTADPCAPGATTAANGVQIYGLDGSMAGGFMLEGFAADLTVDPQTGAIVVADVAGKQIATLDPGSGAPTKVLGNLTCPSAVRVVNGTVFAVTSDRDMTNPDAFILQRVPIKGGTDTATLFSGPNYNIPIDSMPSANGDIGMATRCPSGRCRSTPTSWPSRPTAAAPSSPRSPSTTKRAPSSTSRARTATRT